MKALVVGAMLFSSVAMSHEAVVIEVENGNGVIGSICVAYGNQKYPDSEEDAKVAAKACFDYAAEQMYPQDYVHGHS